MTPMTEAAADPLALAHPNLIETRAWIDGAWVEQARGKRFAVTDPASGDLVAEVVDGDEDMAARAVDAAAAAFESWSRRPAAERSRLIRRWYDLIVVHGEDLARLISREQGKPLAEARSEVAYGAGYVEWFAEEAKRAYGDVIPAPVAGRQLLTFKEPIGVAAVITPWNFPMAMIARKLAPALAAGCTIVAKPAAETPLTALALVRLGNEAGIPPGVLNIVPTTDAAEVAGTWMADARVRKVSFTGSTRVGKLLARQGSDTVKRLSLELGGDAPFIVFDDADLEIAVAGLVKAKFRNMGQACIAANRIYVQAGVYDRFLTLAVEAAEALTIGASADGPADIGPLIHERAVTGLEELIENAVDAGARVLCGGKRHARGGNFFLPTVIADVTADMRICAQEIFGPIIAIARFDDEDEVIRRANASPYGLAAYLFSADIKRIWRVVPRLEVGLVGLNEGAVSTEVAPFGGVKESGYGREGSRYGLADYQNIKYVCLGDLGS